VAQRDDLGVRRRVVGRDRAVVAGRDDLTGPRDDGADWHLAHQPGVLRLVQREPHGVLVGGREIGFGHRGGSLGDAASGMLAA